MSDYDLEKVSPHDLAKAIRRMNLSGLADEDLEGFQRFMANTCEHLSIWGEALQELFWAFAMYFEDDIQQELDEMEREAKGAHHDSE